MSEGHGPVRQKVRKPRIPLTARELTFEFLVVGCVSRAFRQITQIVRILRRHEHACCSLVGEVMPKRSQHARIIQFL